MKKKASLTKLQEYLKTKEQSKIKSLSAEGLPVDDPDVKMISNSFIVNPSRGLIVVNEEYAIKFQDILGYKISENGNTISVTNSLTKGGASIGRAVVGGVLFGGVGAIIGGTTGARTTNSVTDHSETCNEFKIYITVNNINNPLITIDLLDLGTIEKNSSSYRYVTQKAQEITSYLDVIINNNNNS